MWIYPLLCVQLKFSKKNEELQKEVNELRTNLAQIGQSLKMKEKTVAENRDKIVEIGRKLASVGSGGSALEGIQKELTSTVSHCHIVIQSIDVHPLDQCMRVLSVCVCFSEGA